LNAFISLLTYHPALDNTTRESTAEENHYRRPHTRQNSS
jgi:hypothetical protein